MLNSFQNLDNNEWIKPGLVLNSVQNDVILNNNINSNLDYTHNRIIKLNLTLNNHEN